MNRICFAISLILTQPAIVASFTGILPSDQFGRCRVSASNLGLSGANKMPDFHTVAIPTLEHYSLRAEDFWQGTKDHDVTQNREALLRNLHASFPVADPNQGCSFDILDLGCGPGRDIKAFLELGHRVTGQPCTRSKISPLAISVTWKFTALLPTSSVLRHPRTSFAPPFLHSTSAAPPAPPHPPAPPPPLPVYNISTL
jgi:hypothetical protein